MKKGRSVEEIMDEITASSPDIWTKWRAKWKIVTPVAGVIGLLLGLTGLLPGTENSSGT
jgi:hypothetical protein